MTTATKKATHTPGPWKWFYSEERKGIEEIAFYPPDGRKQAFAYASIASPEDTANARLIAAAPEMLEALGQIINCATLRGQNFDPATTQALAMAVDAIRKARGTE